MTSGLLGGANKPWKGSKLQRESLERQYHAWTCKVGYKERQYIDPCVQCINTNINVYPLPTAVQNIYLFCVSPNCKINRDVEGDVAGWKCKLCANESG
jgi:hypothetical protein